MQVTWEPGDCFYKPCSRQHAQATSNQAKSQGFEPNNSQAVHRQRTSPGTLGQVFIQTCYAASSSLIQSRKCSISSSWKSIITAWIWNQRNTQMLRGSQASSIITSSLFPENMSAKVSNNFVQVHIFLSLHP